MANVVSYAETKGIQAFLGYLSKRYSKLINPKDTYLIAAVAAWFHQESGGLSKVIGNNPFNIRPGMVSFMASGVRVSTKGNGKFLVFSSMARGFEAAAYLLIHANPAYGYRLAINALKKGGNQGAVDFLAALAMSSWDAAHYGAQSWEDAYNPKKNHLLRNYLGITGVQLSDPRPPKKKKPLPQLPRDFNYKVVQRNYLDPYARHAMYLNRHRKQSLTVDGSPTKR